MSVIFRQRMTHGLQMLASYTWSHTLDVTTDSNGGGTPMNPYLWKADYGNSNWDIRHRFVASFRLRHPVLPHVQSRCSRARSAGWQANGIITLQTGIPFNVTTRHRYRQHRRQRHLPAEPGSRAERQLRRAAIWSAASTPPPSRSRLCIPSTPTNFAYGNAGRNLIYGPGIETVNFSLFKNFPIKERLKFQFRFETFNLFNHGNFSNPGSTFGTSSFGNITGLSTTSRNIQFGAKLLF